LIFAELKTINVKLRETQTKLSEKLEEEMKKLREEITSLKEKLRELTENQLKRRRGIYIDIGNQVHDYIEDTMEGVAEGIHGELRKSIFIGPGGVRIIRGAEPDREEEEEVNFEKTVATMSALGHEHRMRILRELMSGGKYVNELQEKLSEITTSTLLSHLKILEEAGLVVQEKVRGRYLITIPGRTAYKMACRITGFIERRNEE
jgi:DNA-binding HxlR family transcriptional regulator